MIIRKQFQFDAAHMLSKYEGKCANLHGHTYTGDVEICGPLQHDDMVIDFNKIKAIIEPYDHAILFSAPAIRNTAETELYKWADIHKMRYVIIVHGKCTAENISAQIAKEIAEALKNCIHVKVWLHETPGSTVIGEWRKAR